MTLRESAAGASGPAVGDGLRGRLPGGVVGAAILTLTSSLPVFLVGALAVRLQHDLSLDELELGLAIAAAPAAVAVASIAGGRFVQRFGVATSLRAGTSTLSCALLAIAVWAHDVTTLVGLLAVSGIAAAVNQPAVNYWLVRVIPLRQQGTAFGIKQAATPAASMLAGLAVPTIAMTVGWRWAFVAAAGIAAFALWFVPTSAPGGHGPRGVSRAGDTSAGVMIVLAIGMGLGMAAGISFAGFAVTGGVRAGLSESTAGILFATGSLLGIGARIALGLLADRRSPGDLRIVAFLLIAGAPGYALMSTEVLGAVIVAVPFMFMTVWAWPGVFHLAVAQLNDVAPAAAAGITLAGGASGAVLGPLGFGAVASHSYASAWSLGGACALASGATMLLAQGLIRRERDVAASPPLQWDGCDRPDEEDGRHLSG